MGDVGLDEDRGDRAEAELFVEYCAILLRMQLDLRSTHQASSSR